MPPPARGSRIAIQDIDPESAEAAADALRGTGAEALAVGGSVADPGDVSAAFAAMGDDFDDDDDWVSLWLCKCVNSNQKSRF